MSDTGEAIRLKGEHHHGIEVNSLIDYSTNEDKSFVVLTIHGGRWASAIMSPEETDELIAALTRARGGSQRVVSRACSLDAR